MINSSSFFKVFQTKRDHDLQIRSNPKNKSETFLEKRFALFRCRVHRNLKQEGRRYFDYSRLICVEDLRKLHVES